MANIEGRNPIIEALRSDRPIDKLMISNTSKEGSIKKIIGMAKEKNIVIQYVDKHKLDRNKYKSFTSRCYCCSK